MVEEVGGTRSEGYPGAKPDLWEDAGWGWGPQGESALYKVKTALDETAGRLGVGGLLQAELRDFSSCHLSTYW